MIYDYDVVNTNAELDYVQLEGWGSVLKNVLFGAISGLTKDDPPSSGKLKIHAINSEMQYINSYNDYRTIYIMQHDNSQELSDERLLDEVFMMQTNIGKSTAV